MSLLNYRKRKPIMQISYNKASETKTYLTRISACANRINRTKKVNNV